MKTYYEQLDVKSDASEAEIQAAIDGMYNQWRQAVTHPDATVAEEANRNLRVLEEMRATLTDPVKRAGYDAGIGLGGAAGLADPAAVLKQMPAPPRVKKGSASSGDGTTARLWTCQQCSTDNPPQTKHCFNCGAQLVRQCPNCSQMTSLVATGFCGNCGAQYETAQRIAKLRNQQQAASHELTQAQSDLDQARADLRTVHDPSFPTVSFLVIVGLGLLMIFGGTSAGEGWCAGIGFLIMALGGAVIYGQYSQHKIHAEQRRSDYQKKIASAQQRVTSVNNELASYEVEMAKLQKQVQSRT